MRSLNKTIFLHFLLLIKIVCVVCPTVEDLQRCEEELFSEFRNFRPLDDFVHAFLNIKYETVFWDADTDSNEVIFHGNERLKKSAIGYYNDFFNTALEMGIPEFPTPKDFCSTQYGSEEDKCTSTIEALGCRVNDGGPDCFEKMYYTWSLTSVESYPMPGTSNFSDEQLLEAIYKGSRAFRNLSDKDLFEAFARRLDFIHNLRDEILLEEYYKNNAEARFFRDKNDNLYRHRRRDYNHVDYIHDRFYKKSIVDDIHIAKARLEKYGIAGASYPAICEEYQRRKNLPKQFDNLYAMEICDKLKNSTWDIDNFKNRTEFCAEYLSE